MSSFESLNMAKGLLRASRSEEELIQSGDFYGLYGKEAARLVPGREPPLLRWTLASAAALALLGVELPRELIARAKGAEFVAGPLLIKNHADYMTAHYSGDAKDLLSLDSNLELIADKLAARREKLPDLIVAQSHRDIMVILARKYSLSPELSTTVTRNDAEEMLRHAAIARMINGKPELSDDRIYEVTMSTDEFIDRFQRPSTER